MLKMNKVGPAQTDGASTLLFASNKLGKLLSCVDYQKRNAAIIRKSYSSRRIEEYIEYLEDAMLFLDLER